MAPPTIVKKQRYPTGNIPKHLYRWSVGFAEAETIQTSSIFQWNLSASGTNEYYLSLNGGGDPKPTLTSGTILNPQIRFEDGGNVANNDLIFMSGGTLGSLAEYGSAFGDNDTLGYDTWYVRLPSGAAPPDNTAVVEWDESVTNSGDLQDCTIEWRFTQSPAGWQDKWRTYNDPNINGTIDLATETWTADKTSRIQGTSFSAILDPGTYTIQARVTNTGGEQTIVEWSVTVVAETRTKAVVDSGGGGDYTTLGAALTAGEDWIEVAGGHSETLGASIGINFGSLNTTDTVIEWDGTGDRPEISKSTAAGRWFSFNANDDITMYGLRFPATGTTNNASVVFYAQGCNGLAIVDCDAVPGATPATDLIGFFFQSLSATSGQGYRRTDSILMLSCGDGTSTYEDYFISPQSDPFPEKHFHVIGCDLGKSPTEQVIRLNKLYTNCLILSTAITMDGNDSVRIGDCNGLTMHSCSVTSPVYIGAFVARPIYPFRVRISGNKAVRSSSGSGLATFNVAANGKHTTFVNNVGDITDNVKFLGGTDNPGDAPTSNSNPFVGYAGTEVIKADHNTANMLGGSTTAITGGSGTHVSTSQLTVNLVHDPASGSWTGTAYAAGDWTNTDNQGSSDYGLDDEYFAVGLPTVTKAVTAYDDYWGNIRSGTTPAGAVEYGKSGRPAGGIRGTRNVRSVRSVR